jgi:hypothetical protein
MLAAEQAVVHTSHTLVQQLSAVVYTTVSHNLIAI